MVLAEVLVSMEVRSIVITLHMEVLMVKTGVLITTHMIMHAVIMVVVLDLLLLLVDVEVNAITHTR